MLPGTCRRRTTRAPSSASGNHAFCTISGTVYHRPMRRWSELAERLAATTRTSEKTALLADYLRTLTPEELPIAAVFLTGRPFAEADQRAAGLGWSAIATTVTELGGVPRSALAEAYDRSSDLGHRRRRRPAHGRPRAAARGEPDTPRGGRRVRRDRGGLRAGPQVGDPAQRCSNGPTR